MDTSLREGMLPACPGPLCAAAYLARTGDSHQGDVSPSQVSSPQTGSARLLPSGLRHLPALVNFLYQREKPSLGLTALSQPGHLNRMW